MKMKQVKEYLEAQYPYPNADLFMRHSSILTFNERILEYARSEQCPTGEKIKFCRIIDSNLREYLSDKACNSPEKIRQVIKYRIDNIYRAMRTIVVSSTKMPDRKISIQCPPQNKWFPIDNPHPFLDTIGNHKVIGRKVLLMIGQLKPDLQMFRPAYFSTIVDGGEKYDITGWKSLFVKKPKMYLLEVFPDRSIPYDDNICGPDEDFLNTIREREEFLSKFCYVYAENCMDIKTFFEINEDYIDFSPIKVPIQFTYEDRSKLGAEFQKHSPTIQWNYDKLIYGSEKVDHLFMTTQDSFLNLVEIMRGFSLDSAAARIRISLYRTAMNSLIVRYLIAAANQGIKVEVYLELIARGDELHNLRVFQVLDHHPNITVRCGFYSYKVHAKICLLDYQDGRQIAIVGTGNFNEDTAKIYKDFWYMTEDLDTVVTLHEQFITIFRRSIDERHLPSLYGPTVINRVKSIIDARLKEVIHDVKNYHKSATIILKCNHFMDPSLEALIDEAIKLKVSVTLIVRTTIGIRPRKGLKILSAVGQYLEHDRVYYFAVGDKEYLYLSSADLMFRNLYHRAETIVRIRDEESIGILKNHLCCYIGQAINSTEQNIKVTEIVDPATIDIFLPAVSPMKEEFWFRKELSPREKKPYTKI